MWVDWSVFRATEKTVFGVFGTRGLLGRETDAAGSEEGAGLVCWRGLGLEGVVTTEGKVFFTATYCLFFGAPSGCFLGVGLT